MHLTPLHRLPSGNHGISWGVPWKQGERWPKQSLQLLAEKGQTFPLTSWVMATWPDGSVKWTGHSAVIDGSIANYELVTEDPFINSPKGQLRMKETDESFEIHTGAATFCIAKKGTKWLKIGSIQHQDILKEAEIVTITEAISFSDETKITKENSYIGTISEVVVDQLNDVTCVLHVKGNSLHHTSLELPFSFRIYFYSNIATFRIVHTTTIDTDDYSVQIKGLGIRFRTSLTGDYWSRHVKWSGETGMYSEPAQLLSTRKYRNEKNLFARQIHSSSTLTDVPDTLSQEASQQAVWNDFLLFQSSPDQYRYQKRTSPPCRWVDGDVGTAAGGLCYVGDSQLGISVSIKSFREKYPSAFQVTGLAESNTTLDCWLWPPQSDAMDLRHYSDKTYVEAAYEGFPELRATPHGIANTNELIVTLFEQPPAHEALYERSLMEQQSNLLIATPQTYAESGACGQWSVPDRSSREKRFLEDQLDSAFSFYKKEIEQRKWYGYWNYGDVMHTYDPVRHQWLYDMGGFAWQNTELVPNTWLWYSFFRSGDPEKFEMAAAMTRHTSEVDQYHLGPYKGLGSRHNVSHWGCGCKEVRISMAWLHHYFAYLTTDDRLFDILHEGRNAEYAIEQLDPLREFFDPSQDFSVHIRTGPDWSALVSNWLLAWERSGDEMYRKKIERGLSDIKDTQLRLLSGPAFGFEPKSGRLIELENGVIGGYHMMIAFGAPQVWIDASNLLEDNEWKEMLAEYARLYYADQEEKNSFSNNQLQDTYFHWPMFNAGLAAFAADHSQDCELAQKAWYNLLNRERSHTPLPILSTSIDAWRPLTEIPWITTNTISQWCLNLMMALHFIPDAMPKEELTDLMKEETI
ncbi:hypothetical protein FLK61_23385 [Paenalkalicoccus suaedae]|uniref:Tat pathway signal sequence domain protein n=1 Tax=Paenalkalicoccus suaedae TaxID=2592382 RepID=A0A859FAT5_9BACI|nr:hypothetical protein [Paenalkalicoccus suaedae]QKS69741.1 hypothetical protein FLK61_23385 [Paenalkalicoccus suaedae]